MTTKTKAEMEADYGRIPMLIPADGHFTWTINRAHATVTWVTDDSGETWRSKGVIWAAERARRDNEALEMQRIQRELKG
jgi:hypothetical protein